MSTRAVLSLGSNLGDSSAHLAGAVHVLQPWVRAVSSVYRTPPWGPVVQDDFLNIVVIVESSDVDANGWWRQAQELERAALRTRPVRWGPRTLDVDIVAVWELSGQVWCPVLSDDPVLTLPHPRAAERAFVLEPWVEIEPDAELPGAGTVADLLAATDRTGIELVGRIDRA